MMKEELDNLLSELIFQSYQSALNNEGSADKATEIKEQILRKWKDDGARFD